MTIKSKWQQERLSNRERSIVKLVATGQSLQEICEIMGLSPEEVQADLRSAYTKILDAYDSL